MTAALERYFNIRRDELAVVGLAMLTFFFVLAALMVLRPAREALGMARGIDTVRWLFMGTLAVTLLANPVFGLLVSRFRRITFIAATYLFFAVNLIVFFALLRYFPQAVGEVSGQVFYVWMSVFNLFVTAVFWALMADSFALEQGKRLFGIIAVGGTSGAVFGSWLASVTAEPFGTATLLLIGAGFLALAVTMAWLFTRMRRPVAISPGDADHDRARAVERTIIGGSAWQGLAAVARSPYLLGICGYILLLAVTATFLYFTRLQMVAALGEDTDMRTGAFARIDLYTQMATLVLQAIVAGHLIRRIGVSMTLVLLPIVVAMGFVGLAIVGSLVALVIFEATFKAVQRALQRPARETLFTVVDREDKYKAKALIDTFVYRSGDAVGAQVDGALSRLAPTAAAALTPLAVTVVPLAVVWAGLGYWLGRAQRQRADALPASAVKSTPIPLPKGTQS